MLLEFWKKSLEFCKKYWKFIVGFFVAVFVFFKLRPSPGTSLEEVIKIGDDAHKNEINAEKDFVKKVEEGQKAAEEAHEQRMEVIKQTETVAIDNANQEAAKRTEENRHGSLDDLANNFASGFGANVVRPQNDDSK